MQVVAIIQELQGQVVLVAVEMDATTVLPLTLEQLILVLDEEVGVGLETLPLELVVQVDQV